MTGGPWASLLSEEPPSPNSMESILERSPHLGQSERLPRATAVVLERMYEPSGATRVFLGSCMDPKKGRVSVPFGVGSYLQWQTFLP